MKVINRTEAARLLGMSPNALGCHVYRRNFESIPRPIKVGGKWKWIKEDVLAWLHQRIEEANGKSKQTRSVKRGLGRPRKGSPSCP